MKITEETKIRDLLPEGYVLKSDEISAFDFNIDLGNDRDQGLIKIRLNKKEQKNFEWYINEYLSYKHYFITNHTTCDFKTGNYNAIYFEIKIGLLKFICDDLKIDFYNSLMDLKANIKHRKYYIILDDICPKEFLQSVFE
jgi:hypothetical protein